LTDERQAQLGELAQRLGHRFSDIALLDRALTHASQANEADADRRDNEPLEFLGDAVLGLTVTDLLHRLDPEGSEGRKSQRRAALVSAPSLARRAEALGLPALLRLGRGEEKSGGREKVAIWADAYEAVLAALYLDGGFEAARRFVGDSFAADAEAPDTATIDAKSRLQEQLQARGRALPSYSVLGEEGPDHRRRFRIECRLDDGTVTVGEGSSKKAAEQSAALEALSRLHGTQDESLRDSPRDASGSRP
jgi:ribonuclease-3